MVLSVTNIDNIAPAGARPGVDVTINGQEFGATAGTVRFDPLGENLVATIQSWGPAQVVVTVPALVKNDQFVDVLLTIDGGTDQGTAKFWIPNNLLTGPYTLPTGLGYQLPNAEAGTPNESVDDPLLQQAADVNRLIDKGLAGSGTPAQETFTGETAPQGSNTELALTLSTIPVTDASVQMFLRRDPGGPNDTGGGLLRELGVDYSVNVLTRKITWLATADVALAATDRLTFVYPSRGNT